MLFVCTANICRSPMAAGIFEALAEDVGLDVRTGSAGVAALVGEPAAPQAVRAMDELGIDIGGHRARQVDGAMVGSADLVLTMTPGHREILRKSFEEFGTKIRTLPEYVSGDATVGIADPYGHDLSIFRASGREILRQVESLLDHLRHEQESSDP